MLMRTFLFRGTVELDNLSSVPEARRVEHFLLRHLDPAVRSARHAARLKIADEKVEAAIDKAKVRLVRLRDALADLHATGDANTKSRGASFRGGSRAFNAVIGR